MGINEIDLKVNYTLLPPVLFFGTPALVSIIYDTIALNKVASEISGVFFPLKCM